MSDIEISEFKCPNCGTHNPAEIWKSVNIQMNPESKGEVLERELNSFECSNCENKVFVNTGFFYHDLQNRAMYYCYETEEVAEINTNLETLGDGIQKAGSPEHSDYSLRFVYRYQDLVEKIKLLDAGLDDRVICAVKFMLLAEYYTQGHEFKDIYFHDLAENDMTLLFLDMDDEVKSAELPFDTLYETAFKDFGQKLGESFPIGNYHVVSTATVARALDD